ncbi:PKD domain-containing protein [Halegenticoccus tardaugens]|uniref:PKD domain-containing protein n=1 Tax=Halegenticoccus tardaugens TaxID=2071624 RepID=UPI001E42EAAF|nr:PKD domain-containing protein [Halegenticoccus tardaugens]
MNENYVSDSQYELKTDILSGPDQPPYGLLVHKTTWDLNATSYLFETYSGVGLSKRIQWQKQVVRQLVGGEIDLGSADEDEGDNEETGGDDGSEEEEETDKGGSGGEDDGTGGDSDEPAENEPPVAKIASSPSRAATRTFDLGDTVAFDATGSSDPDGEIASYEWRHRGVGTLDRSGGTAELTFTDCGRARVALRVTDDGGATDTDEVVVVANRG